MTLLTPNAGDFARQLLRHESEGSQDPRALAAAAERACSKLQEELTDVIGSGGVAAVFRRALNLARRKFRLLAGVTLNGAASEGGAPLSLDGLAQSLEIGTAEEAEVAGAALLEQLIGLLVALLGEDLGLRPIREIWPNLPAGEATPLEESEG